jgi:hypothetical protein
VDADSAAAVAANTKGVKDVINDIQVDPLSPMDDSIRIRTYRTIYGYPSLNKYAMDPGRTIRISAQNGRVTLIGVVDSQADKDTAGIRANTVPGVFHVDNRYRSSVIRTKNALRDEAEKRAILRRNRPCQLVLIQINQTSTWAVFSASFAFFSWRFCCFFPTPFVYSPTGVESIGDVCSVPGSGE